MAESEIDVIILCGGLGKRLRSVVSDRPKVLAEIGEKTFLDVVIENLQSQGLKNIILSVGYLKEQIKAHFYNKSSIDIRFSEEDEPLGTGGALKKAGPLIRSDPFIVMNGDSICGINFRDFFKFHMDKKALLSMVLVRSDSTRDFGTVIMNGSNRITGFKEKVSNSSESLVNAGIYLMRKDIFSYMPGRNCFSLEYDVFPNVVNGYGYLTEGKLIDIGTPERYEKVRYNENLY